MKPLDPPPGRVAYRTFNDADVFRIPFLGRRMALLADRSDLDAETAGKILGALDRAADFYAKATGCEPEPNRVHEGRIPIAEVEGIGGAAWAYLGQTGIEIQPAYLDVMVRAVREHGLYDQPLFYELGRNYWLYERRLDVHPGSVATGWAVYMRFLAMDAAGVAGAPYYGWPFAEFRTAVLSLLDRVEKPDWLALLAGPPVAVRTVEKPGLPAITLSTADLLASLFDRLAAGTDPGAFMTRLLAATASLPPANDAAGICANLAAAASAAADEDLSARFAAWGFPPRPVA